MLPRRPVYPPEHDLFRESVRRFAAAEIAPHFDRWERAGIVDRGYWAQGGAAGLLCPQVPEAYGGIGGDFRFNAVVIEELWYAGYAGRLLRLPALLRQRGAETPVAAAHDLGRDGVRHRDDRAGHR